MFVPSHFSILFNHSNFELLLSNVNFSFKVDIFSPMKGKKIFSGDSIFLNFMGISLLFVFYFCLVYGKNATFNTDYLKFLSRFSNSRKAFWFTVIFRLLLVNVAFILAFVINISVLLIDNINLFRLTTLPFFWGLFLVTTLSFSIGCILGSVRNNFKRNTAFFFIYIISAILLPWLLNLYTQIKANDIKPVFEYDHDNLIIVMLEEEKMIKKHGVLKAGEQPTEEMIKDARQVIFNEFKKINENENQLKRIMIGKINEKKFIASLFPVLFYFSICEDISTNGGEGFIDFYTFSQDRKEKFVQFCVDKIYTLPKDKPGNQSNQGNQESQSDQNNLPKVEIFIKNDENLFFAKSKIPRNFWLGSILSVLWIAVCLLVAFRRTLKQIKGEPGEIRDFDVKMKSDELNYLLTADEGLKSQVYNSLSGAGFSSVNIKVDGEILEQKDFIYVYESGNFLKDIDKKILYTELLGKKSPAGIGDLKTWKILVQGAEKTNRMIVFDNFFKGLKVPEVKEIIRYLKNSGIKALYIGENLYEAEKIADNLIFSVDDRSVEGIREVIDEINSH
jgi:hypothetical protein